jgi:hypothetical protein
MRVVGLCAVSAWIVCLPDIILAAPNPVLHRPHRKSVENVNGSQSGSGGLTTEQLLTIAPTANTCDNPPAAGECSTAEQALSFIARSFTNYKVTSRAEQAALIGLMAFETADFKYSRNHFPGVPGQGSTFLHAIHPFLFPLRSFAA